MKTQEQLREQYRNLMEVKWGKDVRMADYCMKTAAYFVELDNGGILPIDKPSIKTEFCYGYGNNGITTEKEQRNAIALADMVTESEEYFIKKNLKDIDEWISEMKSSGYYCLISGDRGNFSYNFYVVDSYLKECEYFYKYLPEATDGEKERILKGLEIVRAGFEKRLRTYLKRYGLSKVRSNTYLVD